MNHVIRNIVTLRAALPASVILMLATSAFAGDKTQATLFQDDQLKVQPGSAWAITNPFHPQVCPPGVNGNPLITGITDVSTPLAPGIRCDTLGVTLQCCETAYAERTLNLQRPLRSPRLQLSFYYDTGVTGDYSTTAYVLTFLRNGGAVETRAFLGAVGANGLTAQFGVPYFQTSPRGLVSLKLNDVVGNIEFDAINVRLYYYGCITSSYQIMSDLFIGQVVEILYKTFIRCDAVGTLPAPWLYDYYAGDNRTFSYTNDASRSYQRAFHSFVYPTSGRLVVGPQIFGVSRGFDDDPDASDIFDPGVGQPGCPQCQYEIRSAATAECTATASPGVAGNVLTMRLTSSSPARDVIDIDLAGYDPCASLVPAVDSELVLRLRRTKSGSLEYRLTGLHDGYPWHELYLNGTLVLSHDPCVTGDDPFSLFDIFEYSVNVPWSPVP